MRFFARCAAVLLMMIMCLSTLGRTAASFPDVYDLIGVRAENKNGDLAVMTRYGAAEGQGEKELALVPHVGAAVCALSAPSGFVVGLLLLSALLILGRDKKEREQTVYPPAPDDEP